MDLEQILSGIQSYRDKIHQEKMWNDPGKLSDVATKLATYNAYLSDHLAPLHKEATDAQGRARARYKKEGMAPSPAETESKYDTTEEREKHENAQFVYKSTDKLINVIQSRTRVVENQIKREGEL